MEKSGCTGVLYTTMCSLESAVGEYSVEVIDNNIQMQDLQMPVIISISNNTQVEPSYHGVTNYHSSTLGGINYMVSTTAMFLNGAERWREIICEASGFTKSYFAWTPAMHSHDLPQISSGTHLSVTTESIDAALPSQLR